MSNFLDYLHDVSGGAPNIEYARIAGVNKSTVGRWDSVAPSLEAVRSLARHYGRPVVEALVAAGHLTEQEAGARVVRAPLAEYHHRALLHELERRLDGMSAPAGTVSEVEEEPNPDDYDLAAGTVARPDDQHAD